jgi:Ion channel
MDVRSRDELVRELVTLFVGPLLGGALLMYGDKYMGGYIGPALYAAATCAFLTGASAVVAILAARRSGVRGKIMALLSGFFAFVVGYAVVYYAIYLRSASSFSAPSPSALREQAYSFDTTYNSIQDISRRMFLLATLDRNRSDVAQCLTEFDGKWITLRDNISMRCVAVAAEPVGVVRGLEVKDGPNVVHFNYGTFNRDINVRTRPLLDEPENVAVNILRLSRVYQNERDAQLTELDILSRQPVRYRYLDFLYFSTVTATTLGYGDIVPITRTARMSVMAQALLALSYVAFGLTFLWPPPSGAG